MLPQQRDKRHNHAEDDAYYAVPSVETPACDMEKRVIGFVNN
jgi:hypothetical protein